MHLDEIRPNVIRKLNDMQDLFALDIDSLVKIARHFRWNNELMETKWFEQKSKLELSLGIIFDKSLPFIKPHINSSLMKNNGGMCLICYDSIPTASSRFGLEQCGHTFCLGCWREYLQKKVEEGCSGIDAKCM
jgi:hypothetical protein